MLLIFSKDNCHKCDMVKNFLKANELEYETRYPTDDEIQQYNIRSFPVIIKDDFEINFEMLKVLTYNNKTKNSKAFNQVNNIKQDCFFDTKRTPGVGRLDVVAHPSIQETNLLMLECFWRPEEINLANVNSDWNKFSEDEKFIFTEVLKRAILLDSIQGRAISNILMPLATCSEVEFGLQTISFFENIHTYSYSYIIRQIYNKPDDIFDTIIQSKELVKCSKSASKYYDELDEYTTKHQNTDLYGSYEHMKILARALFSWNMLEAIRFYSAFIVFFNFAENGLVQPIANIFKLIARDENYHVGWVSKVISAFRKENKLFAQAFDELLDTDLANILNDVLAEEQEWVNYVFDKRSLLGTNATIMNQYLEFLATGRAKVYKINKNSLNFEMRKDNPMTWIRKYIDLNNSQSAPQEIEIITYRIGSLTDDINDIDDMDITL